MVVHDREQRVRCSYQRRDTTKWDKRRSDNDDNVDDRYHGGASSMLTCRDFRGYNLNEKGDITRGGISLMRAYDLLYCARRNI